MSIRGLRFFMPVPKRKDRVAIFKSGPDWCVYWPIHRTSIPFNRFDIAMAHVAFYYKEWR